MRGSKIPVQELWLKMGGGRIREGGRNSGILRYMYVHLIVLVFVYTCIYYCTFIHLVGNSRKSSYMYMYM